MRLLIRLSRQDIRHREGNKMTKKANTAKDAGKKQGNFAIVMKQLSRNKIAMLGLAIFLLLALISIIGPYFYPYSYSKLDLIHKLQGPSAQHWLGTDELGHDILARILYGGRYSLAIGVLVVLLSLAAGSFLGAISGFFGGWVDTVIMRFLDVFQAIPNLLLCVCFSAALGSGFTMTIIALAISRVPSFARMLRAQFMSVSGQEFVEAAESMSLSKARIIAKHVLPNAWSPLIVSATMGVSSSILLASSLSFIGLGVQPPTPEWGAMLSAGRSYIRDYPHLVMIPGVAIVITVLALNLFGDGLRDAMDPKLKN
jgi:peptide/nickel transport system permease protein